MPAYKNILSSLRYHVITGPAIRATTKKAGEYFRGLKSKTTKRRLAIKSKVQKHTRGPLADNPRALSKSSLAGQKRRSQLAEKARATRKTGHFTHSVGRPKPSVLTSSPGKAGPLPRTRGTTRTVAKAVHTSQNYGQLRSKLRTVGVRNTVAKLGYGKRNRNEVAATIKAYRATSSVRGSQLASTRQMVKNARHDATKRAAAVLKRKASGGTGKIGKMPYK